MYSKSAIGQINVGYFSGPWSTTFIAQDGAILAFEDMEQALLQIVKRGDLNGINLKPISTIEILGPNFHKYLEELDILFCNCGPLTSLVLGIRAKNGLNLPLIREIHTLGWVGTFFQEFVANDLSQSNRHYRN